MNITVVTGRVKGNKARKRVGRGEGSGMGKTCGRGNKGMGARTGTRGRLLAEGGMFPLFRRIPKLGFNNANFRTEYQVVNVSTLNERFDDGAHVTAATLFEAGVIRDARKPVKILGDGELAKKLTVEAQRFSAEAQKKIEAGGGIVKKLGPQPKKKFVKRPKVVEKVEEKPAAKGEAAKSEEKKKKGGKDKGKGKGGPEGAPSKGAAEASEE